MRDPLIAAAIFALALVLLIAATAKGQTPPAAGSTDHGSTDERITGPPAALPHDLQVRVLMGQRKVERARADALRAFADLIKTSVGLAWLNAEGGVRDRAIELATAEAQAQEFCGRFPGMVYDAELAQCAVPSVVDKLRAIPSGEKQ